MPRTSKKAQQDKGLAFLADMAGIDLGALQQKVAESAPAQEAEISMLQAEGVLLHIYNLNRTMLTKKCKECNEIFSTRYQAVAYCSNLCRRKAMLRVGIEWDVRVDHYENIGAERPIVLTPEVHQVVVQAAQRIAADQNLVVHQLDQSPTHQQEPLLDEDDQQIDQYPDVPQTNPEPSPQQSVALESLDLDFPSPF